MVRRLLAVAGVGGCLLIGAGSLTAIPSESEAASPSGPSFVIPVNDGYGIAACIDAGSTCGQVVADSWCEAQGFARSASFGPSEPETTGSVTSARRPITVTCAP